MTDQPPTDPTQPGSQPSARPPAIPHPALNSDASRALFEALSRRDYERPEIRPKVVPMYLGAKAVRLHLQNPDYVHQSAHSIRELIEYLPNSFDLPAVRHSALTERVKGLIDSWHSDGR